MTQEQAVIIPLECSAVTGAVSFTGSSRGNTLLDCVGEVGCCNDLSISKLANLAPLLKNNQLLFIEGDDRKHQEDRNACKKAGDTLHYIVFNRQHFSDSMAPYVASDISEPTDKNYFCIHSDNTLNFVITTKKRKL